MTPFVLLLLAFSFLVCANAAQTLTTCTGAGNFVVVTTLVNWASAPCACSTVGLKPADLNSTNFGDATTTTFQCLGAYQGAWVHSWNTDTYQGACIMLNVANALPGGAVNVPASCFQFHPLLCAKS